MGADSNMLETIDGCFGHLYADAVRRQGKFKQFDDVHDSRLGNQVPTPALPMTSQAFLHAKSGNHFANSSTGCTLESLDFVVGDATHVGHATLQVTASCHRSSRSAMAEDL